MSTSIQGAPALHGHLLVVTERPAADLISLVPVQSLTFWLLRLGNPVGLNLPPPPADNLSDPWAGVPCLGTNQP